MYRYAEKSTEAIRAARVSLIAGLSNPRVTPVTKERMRVWITEAEAELVARLNDTKPVAPVAKPAAKRAPMIWEMKAGIREPQDAHDRERLAWSAWS